MRRRAAAAAALVGILALTACTAQTGGGAPITGATIADTGSAAAVADGDLWPNCWADDDNLYAANGDGSGFGSEFSDVGVTRISGPVDDLDGENLAWGDALGQVWSGEDFTRKPTGMACVGGDLYLAVQDLRKDFNAAPASTIARSTDHGATWTWDTSGPMFSDGVFTTVLFLDYGKDYGHAPDDWVYAYGLDGNWRDSFDDSVADPQDLYLARMPKTGIQDRATWEFYTGTKDDTPTWSPAIDDRRPVLHDDRHLYPDLEKGARNLTVISQGGVVYDAPLQRYLYTSWTEYTFEFYDAPQPWGPWTLFASKDFGPYPWTSDVHGGYGLSIPSKFMSDDGLSMWLQSNVCPCAPAGMNTYFFSLRTMTVTQ
jgi:hypothetical protein